jgi:drug/metabolite transporter (DMT)-like permease
MDRSMRAGFALAVAGAILFSTKGIFIKLAFAEGMTAEMVLALRMVVAVPIYAMIVLTLLSRPANRWRARPGSLAAAAGVGILGYFIASLANFEGLASVTAQYERLVLFTYPFFTLVLGVLLFGDRMNWRLVPAMLVGYTGIVILFSWNLLTQPDGLIPGTALILFSALAFALYQHLARRVMAGIGSPLFTCVAMIAAGLVGILWAGVRTDPVAWTALSSAAWSYALALGILGTVLPSFMLNAAIHRIGPRAVASMGNFGPLATIVLAVIVLGEPFTLYHALGTAAVIGGAIWFSRIENRGLAADAARTA